MEVLVKVHSDLRKKAGANEFKVPIDERETIDTLLIKIGKRHSDLLETILDPRTGELREHFNILLNGQRIQHIRGIHTKLKDRDEIAISSPATSG
jgi:MoaD family protein